MRCDQPQGLPVAAEVFLAEHEVEADCCRTCKRPFPRAWEVVGQYEGFDTHNLYRHQLKDGRTADEFLQATPWSSGPMFFLGLRVSETGTEFAWTEKEMDRVI